MPNNDPMTQDAPPEFSFETIFGLYREGEPDAPVFALRKMAADMTVGKSAVNMWHRRGCIPIEHWPRLIAVLAAKWRMQVTADQLMQATLAVRASRREAA
jgi:hypothetical protein